MITVTTTDARMKAFLVTHGLKLAGKNRELSAINKCPTFNVKNAKEAVETLLDTMDGYARHSETPLVGAMIHTFVLPTQGLVRIIVDEKTPDDSTAVVVKPFLK